MKKHSLFFFFIFFLIILTTSCNKPTPTEPTDATPTAYPYTTAEPGTSEKHLSISIGLDGFVLTGDAISDVIESRLNIGLFPVDVYENDAEYMEALAASGALPDLVRIDISEPYFISWLENGIIRDLPASYTQKYPLINNRMEASDELQAVARLNRQKQWFIPVGDTEPYLTADSGRIYYRKDWLAELEMDVPVTLEEFQTMLTAFASKKKTAGITLAGGVTYLLTLYGTDPESWIYENGEWIPAYYSDRMLEGLLFVRSLYETGALDVEYTFNKSNTAINKLADGMAGALIRRGDAYWMHRVYSAFSARNGEYEPYVGILPPPGYWPRSVETGGCVVSAAVNNEKLDRILSLLAFTLSDEGREMAYFGIQDETCAKGADGMLKLFIDPETTQPFDIMQQYPSAQLLFILDRTRARLGEYDEAIPSDLPPAMKAECFEAAQIYNAYAVDEGDAFLIRFLQTPAKSAAESAIDPGAAFNAIVTGTAEVEEMFAAFQADCRDKNILTAINEVTARMKEIKAK